jgi:hypothetical protein
MAAKTTKKYRALTHLSVHRDREAWDRAGEAGADFVERGDPVELDEARAARLLKLGAVEEWGDEAEKFPTARDMSGKAFPDQGKQAAAGDPGNQPEATDVQPKDPGDKEGAPDPYAK